MFFVFVFLQKNSLSEKRREGTEGLLNRQNVSMSVCVNMCMSVFPMTPRCCDTLWMLLAYPMNRIAAGRNLERSNIKNLA